MNSTSLAGLSLDQALRRRLLERARPKSVRMGRVDPGSGTFVARRKPWCVLAAFEFCVVKPEVALILALAAV